MYSFENGFCYTNSISFQFRQTFQNYVERKIVEECLERFLFIFYCSFIGEHVLERGTVVLFKKKKIFHIHETIFLSLITSINGKSVYHNYPQNLKLMHIYVIISISIIMNPFSPKI